ncbi:MAG: hypothetical protein PHD05_00065 [Sphaerochaetaceae bacterium]|jgi:hypothetical protein|nr:hypothetical protein [Sphaerochaetaceae bacterium]
MDKKLGIPVEEFVKAVSEAYMQGFGNAIEQLQTIHKTFDIEQMKKNVLDMLKRHGKIKADW